MPRGNSGAFSLSLNSILESIVGVPLKDLEARQIAAFSALGVVIGWLITYRQLKEKFRLENAGKTLLHDNEIFLKFTPQISPYFRERKSFPKYKELTEHPKNRETLLAIQKTLNLLEGLALDVATGRASE